MRNDLVIHTCEKRRMRAGHISAVPELQPPRHQALLTRPCECAPLWSFYAGNIQCVWKGKMQSGGTQYLPLRSSQKHPRLLIKATSSHGSPIDKEIAKQQHVLQHVCKCQASCTSMEGKKTFTLPFLLVPNGGFVITVSAWS